MCIFIGYSSNHKGSQCLHSSRRVYISNHVVFNEKSFPYVHGIDFSITISSQTNFERSSSSSFVIQLQAPLATISTSKPLVQ